MSKTQQTVWTCLPIWQRSSKGRCRWGTSHPSRDLKKQTVCLLIAFVCKCRPCRDRRVSGTWSLPRRSPRWRWWLYRRTWPAKEACDLSVCPGPLRRAWPNTKTFFSCCMETNMGPQMGLLWDPIWAPSAAHMGIKCIFQNTYLKQITIQISKQTNSKINTRHCKAKFAKLCLQIYMC